MRPANCGTGNESDRPLRLNGLSDGLFPCRPALTRRWTEKLGVKS